MRFFPINSIQDAFKEIAPELEIARDVIYMSPKGLRMRFASKGIKVMQRHYQKLSDLGIDILAVKDPLLDGVNFDFIIDEDSRVALKFMLDDFAKTVESILDKFFRERGKNSIDSEFRDYWRWHCDMTISQTARYKKNIQDLIYIIRSNFRIKHLPLMPFPYTLENYLSLHAINTALLAGNIAIRLGDFNSERLMHLVAGAILHDAGFPLGLFQGKYDGQNGEIYRRHPRIGCMVINETEGLTSQMGIISLEHHRYINNTGFPEDIPEKDFYGYPRHMHLYSKIVSIAEHFVTLSMWYPGDKVIKAMREFSGVLFESEYIELFEDIVLPFSPGQEVILETGEKAIVIGINKKELSKPVVRILKTAEGRRPSDIEEINLSRDNISITGLAYMDKRLKRFLVPLYNSDLIQRLEEGV